MKHDPEASRIPLSCGRHPPRKRPLRSICNHLLRPQHPRPSQAERPHPAVGEGYGHLWEHFQQIDSFGRVPLQHGGPHGFGGRPHPQGSEEPPRCMNRALAAILSRLWIVRFLSPVRSLVRTLDCPRRRRTSSSTRKRTWTRSSPLWRMWRSWLRRSITTSTSISRLPRSQSVCLYCSRNRSRRWPSCRGTRSSLQKYVPSVPQRSLAWQILWDCAWDYGQEPRDHQTTSRSLTHLCYFICLFFSKSVMQFVFCQIEI